MRQHLRALVSDRRARPQAAESVAFIQIVQFTPHRHTMGQRVIFTSSPDR